MKPRGAVRFVQHGPVFATAALLLVFLQLATCSTEGHQSTSAVGNSGGGNTEHGVPASAGSEAGATGVVIAISDGGNAGPVPSTSTPVVIMPASLIVSVAIGEDPAPTKLTATVSGKPVDAAWTVDQGNVGMIAPTTGSSVAFVPSGKSGGSVQVTASFNGGIGRATVVVNLAGAQNGANAQDRGEAAQMASSLSDLTQGGGIGGVGGEGLGPAVTDAATLSALASPIDDGSSETLILLYPYDKTVWPRGMLAPLLMWHWSLGDADAVRIDLSTSSGTFTWSGTFGRPVILEALRSSRAADAGTEPPGNFIRHPIPQDVWDMATNTATMADRLTLQLTIAKGGKAYGPVTRSWIVAPGRLAGTVYYNSYGTLLVKDSGYVTEGRVGEYGAGVLAIRSGAAAPTLVAGTPSSTNTGCRGCHMVSANGSRLIAQSGPNYYAGTSTYDLLRGNEETQIDARWNKVFAWAALSADGTLAFTSQLKFGLTDVGAPPPPSSQLYAFPPAADASPISFHGMSADVQAGTPAFSPDSRHLAFDLLGGSVGSISGTGRELVSVDFDRTSMTFSNARLLARTADPERVGFPSFFPTNDAVVFQRQLDPLTSVPLLPRGGMPYHARIEWSDMATGAPTILGGLNGIGADGQSSYLPKNDQHPDDTVLNFEPTVNPVSTGGYFWVVFTSRRKYGNLADGDPWRSNPTTPRYDYTDYLQITTKKLWVAAVDMGSYQNGQFVLGNVPGSDPSHPAFYLPAQELVAGNSRGFWVLDPCRPDGAFCESGDECCNGYCRPSVGKVALTCTNAPPTAMRCAQAQEGCGGDVRCCDPTDLCINGFCALASPVQPR